MDPGMRLCDRQSIGAFGPRPTVHNVGHAALDGHSSLHRCGIARVVFLVCYRPCSKAEEDLARLLSRQQRMDGDVKQMRNLIEDLRSDLKSASSAQVSVHTCMMARVATAHPTSMIIRAC